jgi:Asp-tRNA(Asn)/Glu-tRNA(Gln) amidotransferase C subunit
MQARQRQRQRVLVRAGESEREIPPPDVRKLAQMARMQVTEEEVEQWGAQLGKIAEWSATLPPSFRHSAMRTGSPAVSAPPSGSQQADRTRVQHSSQRMRVLGCWERRFDQLQATDVSGVEPALRGTAGQQENVLRADEEKNFARKCVRSSTPSASPPFCSWGAALHPASLCPALCRGGVPREVG